MLRMQCICVDAKDPASLATFWEQALGWRRTGEEPDEVVLEPPVGSAEEGVAPDLLFLRVPEGKTRKNRLHLDLRPDHQTTEVARLEQLGATPRARSARARTRPGSCWRTPRATSSACSGRSVDPAGLALLLRRRGEPPAKLALGHLAERGARQLVHDLDPPRQLVARQLAP